MIVAIQGELGSFHHAAAQVYFGDTVTIMPCDSFSAVFDTLSRHEADIALVAIENSLYGSINEVYDLIEKHRYPLTGEVFLRIEQQLIGLPGASLSDITAIYSHPVALAQCEQYLDSNFPGAKRISYHDTAAAVEYVSNKQNPHIAAIASRAAASLHNLSVLDSNIEDNKTNYTRFVAISRTASKKNDAHNKASLVLETDHQPGSLAKILSIFSARGINMTKLQSRPIIGEAWTYRFYIDIEITPSALESLLPEVAKFGADCHVLGTYASNR